MKTNEKFDEYQENGVILLKGVLPRNVIDKVRERYESLDSTLINQDIPRDKPCIVFWKHVEGEQKRIATFQEFPELWDLIVQNIIPVLRSIIFPYSGLRLQLLESIIFNKPAKLSNTLHWHQDVAYFPLHPNNQIAVWVPFEPVTKETGAMNYALKTHKLGHRGSVNLHTREPFKDEDRELIPNDPQAAGFEVVCKEMDCIDMLIHDGYIWHYSGPNTKEGHQRRGLSVRFIVDEARFDPRPGQGAAFTKQIDVKPGEIVGGLPFPVL